MSATIRREWRQEALPERDQEAPSPQAAGVPREWNRTDAEYPREKCVHELFEAQAAWSPDAVAVVHAEQRVTYRELNARANALGRYLKKRGVGPEVLVGLCVRRSIEMVVGILGILKAGGAYVPLDPTYPRERLAMMVEDARTPVVLTQEALLGIAPDTGAERICLDKQWGEIGRESGENFRSGAGPENLAYVIFTSGSTGRPKGAMIVHRGVVNYLWWAVGAYNVRGGAGGAGGGEGTGGAPVQSSISFDLTVTSLFAPLVAGKYVHLVPEAEGIEGLTAMLRRERNFALVKITPAHLELLSRQLSPAEAAGRTRAFIIGGENLSAEAVAFWQAHAPDTELINEYGPTETVVGCCIYRMARGERRSGIIPIGQPIANTQLYVVDDRMRAVGVGEAGELCIGGAGVARGYLNAPELTARKFVDDPFGGGGKLYRTGDLCRYLPDGNLECLGRMDHQVKIRGYRVELGEIEAALRGHASVRECAVLAREDRPGDKRLVAYVVRRDGAAADAAEMHELLRRHVREKLPAYMVPSAFVAMNDLPLTVNGKVDRKALPEPMPEDRSADETFAAPQTQTERAVAELWEREMGISPVGRRDDFFDLGGHSLMAARLVSTINGKLHTTLGILELFEHPTIERLAARIDGNRGTAPGAAGVVKLKPNAGAEGLPVYFIYAGPDEWRVAQGIAGREVWGVEARWPVAWRNAAEAEREESMPTLEELAAPYTAALRGHLANRRCVLAGYSFGGLVAFEVVQQLHREIGAGRVEQVLLLDSWGKYLTPREVWRNIWGRRGIKCGGEPRANLIGRLKDSWRAMPWTLREEAKKIRRPLPKPAVSDDMGTETGAILGAETLTHILDEQGAAMPWGLIYRLYMKARAGYRYVPASSRGVLFRAEAGDTLADATMGWANLFADGLELIRVPGTHHTMIQMPAMAELLGKINESIVP